MSEIEFESELTDNSVHHRGSFLAKIKNGKNSLLDKLLGRTDVLEFPASVEEAGKWQEGDKIKITVENKDR